MQEHDVRTERVGNLWYAYCEECQRDSHGYEEQERERRNCFYCLEGWVFLGSLDHDGEGMYESILCRRCGGTSRLA